MPNNRGRQNQLAKRKKKRDLAREHQQQRTVRSPPSVVPGMTVAQLEALRTSQLRERAGLLELAPSLPVGPAFVSGELGLVSLVITRVLNDGQYVMQHLRIEQNGAGVKGVMSRGPMSEEELAEVLTTLLEHNHNPGREITPLEAQSIVYHAIDFARGLGHSPHPDFNEAVIGRRPDKLLDDALTHPDLPLRTPIGGHDDEDTTATERKISQLRARQLASRARRMSMEERR